MNRYITRKGPLECCHVDECAGRPISTISVIDHNLPALELAFHLAQAADWFRQIAEGKIAPLQAPRIKALAAGGN